MQFASLLVSILALLTSLGVASRQLRTSRTANSVSVLIGLFTEHRGHHLASARQIVFNDAASWQCDLGMAGVPEGQRDAVRDLMWFYDNLGALVVHGVVNIKPVSAYLGASVLGLWDHLKPIIEAERMRRRQGGLPDADRWQGYFELLHQMASVHDPSKYRRLPITTRVRLRTRRI